MTEYMELLAVVEAVAAGDMTRGSMIELAKECLGEGEPEEDSCDHCEGPLTNRITVSDSVYCSQKCADEDKAHFEALEAESEQPEGGL